MCHPEGFARASMALGEVVKETKADYVGGVESGALFISSAILASLGLPHARRIRGFFIRKKPKDHGLKGLIAGLPRNTSLWGKRVIVVEDTTTTADSALKGVAAVEAEGGIVVLVLTLFDREEGAAEMVTSKGYPFKAIMGTRRDKLLRNGVKPKTWEP